MDSDFKFILLYKLVIYSGRRYKKLGCERLKVIALTASIPQQQQNNNIANAHKHSLPLCLKLAEAVSPTGAAGSYTSLLSPNNVGSMRRQIQSPGALL